MKLQKWISSLRKFPYDYVTCCASHSNIHQFSVTKFPQSIFYTYCCNIYPYLVSWLICTFIFIVACVNHHRIVFTSVIAGTYLSPHTNQFCLWQVLMSCVIKISLHTQQQCYGIVWQAYCLVFILWRNSRTRTWAASLMLFLDHTQLDTLTHSVGLLWTSDQLVAETATYETHNKHKRRISIPLAEFEPATPAIERPQSYALDRTATETGELLS